MTSKHPVSYLQEEMVKLRKPPPFYDIKACPGGFICNLVVEDITTSAICASKSAAKHEAAYKATLLYQEKLNIKNTNIISPSTVGNNSSLNDSSLSSSILNNSSSNSSNLSTSSISLDSSLNSSQIIPRKHPISELQELMAGQRKPLPNYIVIDKSTPNFPNFHCTLIIEGKSYTAEGSNKQAARIQCAKSALDDLKLNDSKCLETTDGSSNLEQLNDVNYNAIGTLNEYLQKRFGRCANFQEMGCNTNGQFVIVCGALGKTCEGYGCNKKQAKQSAAHKMIKMFEIDDAVQGLVKKSVLDESTESVINLNNLNDKVKVSDEDIIKKFTELTIPPGEASESKLTEEVFTGSPSVDHIINGTTSQVDLINSLQSLGCDFYIDTLPSNDDNFILALRFSDESKTTVLDCGSDYEETKTSLLKRALQIKTTLSN